MRWTSTRRGVLAGLALLLLAAAVMVGLNGRDAPGQAGEGAVFVAAPGQAERGAYLARAGNCAACHTARGGAAYAGGRAIATPFGTVFTSNLTPDAATGLGQWSAVDFWRALHEGRSKDGRRLLPACPYPNYTQVTRADADDLYAHLKSLPPVAQAHRPHALRFPYDTQVARAAWQLLFFRPGEFQPVPGQTAEWNRGAYLVRGLGHCAACHAERNAFGATQAPLALAGGMMPLQHWYAPSLAAATEAGVADWAAADVVALLKTGTSARGSVLGPMAEVVYRSTQHLTDADLRAMATYLMALPPVAAPVARTPVGAGAAADPAVLLQGRQLYEQHCANCHGDQGQGAAGAYPPLAGNRALTMASPANLVRVVVAGGYPPGTAGNPRPYGMPPFGHSLADAEIAALLSYLRSAWGHAAAPVSPLDVLKLR
jgi:mono/diheme cytochrome c family protein